MPLVLELRACKAVVLAAVGYVFAVAAALLSCGASTLHIATGLTLLAMLAVWALPTLGHGRTRRALRCLRWYGGADFEIEDGAGRCMRATLAPISRRIGRAMLLKFNAPGRPWVLLLPQMTDAEAGRRLRVALGLGSHRL
jgi:hypothetical protein